jgi:Acetyltransferase (GNAT) family.
MELTTLTPENLAQEHICCAISNAADIQVASKKAWLAERMKDGLVFTKGDVRGKCFIEYIPAEYAWAPVTAPGCMYIDCLWVSGQFAGQGISSLLLDECIRDSRAKGKTGIVVLSSQKKKLPFLSDPAYLKHKGFTEADAAAPYFSLMYLPLDGGQGNVRFRTQSGKQSVTDTGFAVYYSHQCPFTAKYVPLLAQTAASLGVEFTAHRFETAAQAQNAPSPFTTFSLFHNGAFVTHEILSEKKFAALCTSAGR